MKDKIVLVGVLKNKRDLNILLTKNWYRIPKTHATRRQFNYLAFYQPALFGQKGKCIRYYAHVLNYQIAKRKKLLPEEISHPRACDDYLKIQVGKVGKLPRPVRNIIPRRVSFGFTTLKRLLKSKNILQLYNIAPTEQMVEDGLRQAGIRPIAQYRVSISKKPRRRASGSLRGRRFCLDFAIFCKRGSIAVECDNKKAHSSPCQQKKDKIKNTILGQCGWTVIRLSEHEIISDLKGCMARIKKTVRRLNH